MQKNDILDLVAVIARTLENVLPSMPMDLSLRYAEQIASAIEREGYTTTTTDRRVEEQNSKPN